MERNLYMVCPGALYHAGSEVLYIDPDKVCPEDYADAETDHPTAAVVIGVFRRFAKTHAGFDVREVRIVHKLPLQGGAA